ncbi:MAG: hypothetical protein J7K29_06920 [Candidatus Cloacimonetes bacterium]|nr:hypothetical protein [Candidatus Cloacimonadota bacterium]
MASNVVKADNALIKVWDGVSAYLDVGAQRGATLTINTDTIETTAKQDDWAEFVAGKRNWTLDCDALVVITDNGRLALESAATNGTEVQVKLVVDSKKYEGNGIITSYQITGSMGDVTTYSISIQGTGALTIADDV